MWNSIIHLFSTQGFMPHGHCYLWQPPLVWTHVISDSLIGIAYFSISVTLYVLVKKIKIPFSAVVLCFGIFIGACGLTHIMEVYTLWNPAYWWSGLIKVITAIASVGTGVYLIRLRHSILTVAEAAKLSEQRRLDLEVLTSTLEKQVALRTQELTERESQLKLITDSLPVLISYIDFDRKYRFINAGYEKWFHQNKSEILGKYLWELLGDEAYKNVESKIDEAFAGGVAIFEGQMNYSFAGNRFIRASYVPDKDTTGKVRGIVTLLEDITERKRAEEALQASEEFNRRILESSDDCFNILSLDGRLEFLSERSQDHLEIGNVNKVIGKSWIQFWKRPEDVLEAQKAVQAAARGGRGHFMGYYRTPSGKREWWSVVITPFRGLHGKPEKLLAISRDETPIKRTEAELIESLARERQSRERIESLANDLRQTLVARDHFISIASHELKTPVTSIKMQTQTFLRQLNRGHSIDFSRVSRIGTTLTSQIDKLTQLIEDMLDVSRIQFGHFSVHFRKVDVSNLVREVIGRIRENGPLQGTPLSLEITESIHANWDPVRIEQLLNNLISNAIKYGEKKPVAIRVRMKAPATAEIIVIDQGIGISKENLAKVFDRFERAVSHLSISGFGLGLYIARRIVELHHGTIRVESELGQGSQFVVEIPLDPEKGATYEAA